MRHWCGPRELGRDEFLSLLGVGLLGLLTGCASRRTVRAAATTTTAPTAPPSTTSLPPTTTTLPALPPIPPPYAGPPRIVSRGAAATRQVALTIDDGYCRECVDGYVEIARRTGVPLTFNPNGVFGDLWAPHAAALRALIAAGQVQVGNHTWSHPDLTAVRSSEVRRQIARNEGWIEDTFGITARPYFRPPFGHHDRRVDDIAGGLGYTTVLMWNGTFGDATVETPDQLLALATRWVQPGAVVLGHANHPTVLQVFDQIAALIKERALIPVTIDEMFGTSRATGRATSA